jgi:cob(I)alamin adenosyltransferase
MKRGEGIILVNTGGGKGKTTAALGIALRACGYDLHGVMIQFIKGSWFYGEKKSFKKLAPNFKLITHGKGFVGIIDDKLPFKEHKKIAREAIEIAKKEVIKESNDIVILDEINYAAHGKLITIQDILDIIKLKNPTTDLILTGNYADKRIIDLADTVTEMKEIKHTYSKGKLAKIGIDF